MESSKISFKRTHSNTTTSRMPKIPKLDDRSRFADNELTLFHEDIRCSICSEILIKATTLNCSHTFCKYCIDRWTDKQSDCPICRSKITYKVPTLILDKIAENIVQGLPKHMQKHREKVIAERHKNIVPPRRIRSKNGWIKMRRMNGLNSYYMVPKYVNARRHLNEVTIMYFEDDPEWDDLGIDNPVNLKNR